MNSQHLILSKSELFNDYFLNDEAEPIFYLPNFNIINVIIGANNSGKSRFMRHLLSLDTLEFIYDDIVNDYNSTITKYNDSGINEFRVENINLRNLFKIIQSNKVVLSRGRYSAENTLKSQLTQFEQDMLITSTKYSKYYIPTLRSAHSLYTHVNSSYNKIEDDIYLNTLVRNYKFKSGAVDVFTGLHLYKNILNARNSKREIRESFEKFEEFISKYFFNGKKIDIVAEFNKDNSLKGNNELEIISVHIAGEEDKSLYDLGDGIQAIIILMYKIFMAEKGSLICIDEPELNLHPGMQRLFLEQISSNPELEEKKLTFFISTHSNHFLDLTIEQNNVSIYSFSPKDSKEGKSKQFVIKNVNRGDNSILKHLGVNNSSVFMANCSLWVEGVSDRNYIKAFLKSYLKGKNKTLKEDIDYAFFEYAGSNIAHYMFEEDISESEEEKVRNEINALALSNKIFLLADSDNVDGRTKKGKRLKELEENEKANFIPKIIREVREIENLLTNEVWENVLVKFCNKKLMDNHESEVFNRISDALTKHNSSDYKKDYIGVFLNKVDVELKEIDNTRILNKIYEIKSDGSYGTFIQKSELSQYVLEADIEWEVFAKSKEIETLTKEIYQFIIDSMN
jgi:predicted ATP-dependent endonuclease of OLD family